MYVVVGSAWIMYVTEVGVCQRALLYLATSESHWHLKLHISQTAFFFFFLQHLKNTFPLFSGLCGF